MLPKKFLVLTIGSIALSLTFSSTVFASDSVVKSEEVTTISVETLPDSPSTLAPVEETLVVETYKAEEETPVAVKNAQDIADETHSSNIEADTANNPITETITEEINETTETPSISKDDTQEAVMPQEETKETTEMPSNPKDDAQAALITPVESNKETSTSATEKQSIKTEFPTKAAQVSVSESVVKESAKPAEIVLKNHTVQKGDTLFLLAKKYISTVNLIKKVNSLKSDLIYIGQFLKIPSMSAAHAATASTNYTVKKGDTLFIIGKKFGVSVSSIKSLNSLKSDALFVGQVLKISGATTSTQATGTKTVTVQKGDTLFLLSKKHGVTVSTIKSLNGLKSNALFVGQTLKIPASSTVNSNTSDKRTSTASRFHATRSEVLLLARLIYGESRGEPYEGQVAVGAVVINRVRSSLFPNSIAEVIYQRNEFSVVLDGQINLNPDATAMKAAEAALNSYDPTNGALFYWNPVKAPNNKFLNAKPIIKKIGAHVFAK